MTSYEVDTAIQALATSLNGYDDREMENLARTRVLKSETLTGAEGVVQLREATRDTSSEDYTETIDVNPFFSKELDMSGSFDLTGIIETSLGKFLNALPIPVLVVDSDNLVIYANEAYEARNSEDDSIVGRGFLNLFPSREQWFKVQEMMKAVLVLRKEQVAPFMLNRRGGKLWGRLCMRPIRIGADRFVLVVIEDRTAEMKQILLTRKNEEELEKRVDDRTADLLKANELMRTEIASRKKVEAKLRLAAKIIESTTEAIFVTDVDGTITHVNGAFTRISGYEKDEVVGKDLNFFDNDRHDPGFYEKVWQTVLNTGEWHGEIWDRRKNGDRYAKMLSVSAVKSQGGVVSHYVGIFRDITKMKEHEHRLHRMAHFDALTGLPNRGLFYDRVNQAIHAAKRYGHAIAIMLLDLDRFKNINDTLGHGLGDQLLIAAAERLKTGLRKSDTAARLGGDEFGVCLPIIRSSLDAVTICKGILKRLAEPIHLNGRQLVASASIGIAHYPADGDSVELLLQNADTAMYHAKERGRNNFQFFSKEMNDRALNRLELENNLRDAMSNDKLVLHYQPVVDLNSMHFMGMEALLRWKKRPGMVVSAKEFIPVAEETGLIMPIGEWALRTACRQNERWQQMRLPVLPVAVNVSGKQLRQGSFVDTVMGILDETKLDPVSLEIELTETILMEDSDGAIKKLEMLQANGVRVSMDDFGTGYSSLSCLRRLPISKLKIDQSFVQDIGHPYEQALVESILAVAHSKDLKVIAEGVESSAQVGFLKDHGCDGAQGYFFSKAVPAEEIAKMLNGNGRTRF